jgi:phospholipase/carboxylesterase
VSRLEYVQRPAAGAPQGLLVLHHGRGSHEHNMLALGDVLDPSRRFHVVAPRGPLESGAEGAYQWYLTGRVGFPDPPSFALGTRQLAQLHDELWQATATGPERTVLGGFSMGTVMSYALGLDPDRPAPAGILAFSGYLPSVEGWRPDLSRQTTRVFISHSVEDELIDIEFARATRGLLERAGFAVDYGESQGRHTIEAAQIRRAVKWFGTLELGGC